MEKWAHNVIKYHVKQQLRLAAVILAGTKVDERAQLYKKGGKYVTSVDTADERLVSAPTDTKFHWNTFESDLLDNRASLWTDFSF